MLQGRTLTRNATKRKILILKCRTRFPVGLSLFPPQLSELPTDNRTPLDARHHDLEAIEVGHRSTAGAHSQLAAPGAVGPFVVHLGILVGLLEHLLQGRAGELGDGDVGERQTLKINLRADHVGGVDERPVLVDDVHNDYQLPVVGPVVDEGHPPDLHKPAEHHDAGWARGVTDVALEGTAEMAMAMAEALLRKTKLGSAVSSALGLASAKTLTPRPQIHVPTRHTCTGFKVQLCPVPATCK